MGTTRISLTYPPNIDPTRATLAYGNWAPARLKRELEDDTLRVRQLAVYALSQYVHDPENVASVINVGVMSSLKQLLMDSDETCRKVAADCVGVLNTHAIGRHACIKYGLLEPLEELLSDEDEECRITSNEAINMLCESVEGCLGVIETNSLLPTLVSVINQDVDAVKPLALQSLSKTLMADVGPAHDQILESDIFDTLVELISHPNANMRLHSLDLLASLTFSRKAKVILCDRLCYEFLESITEEIVSDNWKARSKAALALANMCMFAQPKKIAISLGAIKLLFLLTGDSVSEVRSNALSAITRLAEHPLGRTESLKYVSHLKPLLDDPVAGVRKQAEIAVKVITWKP